MGFDPSTAVASEKSNRAFNPETANLVDKKTGFKMTPEDTKDFGRQAQSTVSYPKEDTALGAVLMGARRGVETVGEGFLQRGAELASFLGFDTDQFQKDLKLAGDIQEQKQKTTKEDRPISSFVGEVAGSIAAFPVAPAKIPQAMAAGAGFGLLQPTDGGGSDIAVNVAQNAALGGVGAYAAPYIQKGFNKSQALFSGLYKKATGADPRPEMFLPSGSLSDEGKVAMDKVGVSEEDFARLYSQLDENLDPVAAMRVERAGEQGIDLTTAQATKDFAQQEAEQTLRSVEGREGSAARSVADTQQEGIKSAQETFERSLGPVADREIRGETVQKGLREIQKEGRKEVSKLYDVAKETVGESIPIDNARLLDFIDDEVMSKPVEDSVTKSIESLMGKFGLIGGDVTQKGRFNQVIDDIGQTVTFKGEQTPLSLANANDFRKGLNRIYDGDQSGAVGNIVKQLDSQVDEIVSGLPDGSARTGAFREATAAARDQRKIFKAKDVIQKITDMKPGTKTNQLEPDRIIDSLLKGENVLSNMRKVKSASNSKPSIWKSVKAQGAADLFSKSIGPGGDISGARLVSSIKQFGGGSTKEGEKRLKVLFGENYKEFDNLVKAIGDATIPVKGTTNPSGTAYKLINFMKRMGNFGTGALDMAIPFVNKVKDTANSQSVLKSIQKAKPEKVKQAVKANDAMIDAYIQLGLNGLAREASNK
jgi:hypothetical protein